jgi:uncharacterized protein YeeX (DUF496 family)
MLRRVALVRIDVSEEPSASIIRVTRVGELFVRNSDHHRDLRIETVTNIIAKFANSHEKRLQDHINIEASRLLNVSNITRRLKRRKPPELVIR